MAERKSKDDILEGLKDELTCSLCLDIYEDPKRLPCDHVFCRKCLQSLALKNTSESIKCPICRKDTAVLSCNVDTFPTAYQSNSLKELYLKSQKANNAAVPTCEIHPSQPLDFYCKSCNNLVCSYCVISSCMKRNHEHGGYG